MRKTTVSALCKQADANLSIACTSEVAAEATTNILMLLPASVLDGVGAAVIGAICIFTFPARRQSAGCGEQGAQKEEQPPHLLHVVL